MKLEPNMYVRTKEGKIFNCFASESMGKPVYYIKDSLTNGFIDYNEAYKVSPNIIDIVQVGDYVNGLLVTRICEDYETKEKYINLYGCISEWGEEDIKSTVTKEQFESISYKVGDSNE